MRILAIGCLFLVLLSAGCAHKKREATVGSFSTLPGVSEATPPAPASPGKQSPIVTPENALSGKVVSVNPTARFAVVSFALGKLPAAEQQFSVYRRGLKVGDIRITNQQLNEYIIADILDGDAEAGDEVRNR